MIIWQFIKLLGKSIADFFRDGGFMLAGSLSYFSIMTVVPLCLFLISIFVYSIGDNEALSKFIAAKIVNLFPKAAHDIVSELREALSYRGIGVFTFIIYGALSYQLYSALEYSLNIVFKVKEKRSFISHLLISLFIITLLLIFILISFGASSSILILNTFRNSLPGIEVRAVTAFLIKYAVPFMLAFVTVATLFIIMPKKRVGWANALIGALIAAVFHEAAKHAFTFYVVKVAMIGAIYGPLAAFIIFLLWAFYSSCIFLIGAEIVHNLEVRKKQRKTEGR
jgi:membrane protein